jgi:hypothetical protein
VTCDFRSLFTREPGADDDVDDVEIGPVVTIGAFLAELDDVRAMKTDLGALSRVAARHGGAELVPKYGGTIMKMKKRCDAGCDACGGQR